VRCGLEVRLIVHARVTVRVAFDVDKLVIREGTKAGVANKAVIVVLVPQCLDDSSTQRQEALRTEVFWVLRASQAQAFITQQLGRG
jgi:hypothetical protein